MRALAAFDPNKPVLLNTHFTGAAIQLNGEGPAPALNDSDFNNSIISVRQKVAAYVGRQVMSEQDRITAIGKVLNEEGYIGKRMNDAGFSLTSESRDILTRIVNGKIGLETGLQQLNPTQRQQIAQFTALEEIAAGTTEMRENPQTQYEAIRRMYLEGTFDSDPVGKQYAYEFLEAGRLHAKDYFGVHDITTQYVPPVFENTNIGQVLPSLQFQPY